MRWRNRGSICRLMISRCNLRGLLGLEHRDEVGLKPSIRHRRMRSRNMERREGAQRLCQSCRGIEIARRQEAVKVKWLWAQRRKSFSKSKEE